MAAAGANITKQKYIEVLIKTLPEILEAEFQGIIQGKNDLQLTFACVTAIGNIVLHSFSNTFELVIEMPSLLTDID